MVPSSHDVQALAELVSKLEVAASADRTLDLQIEYCVGVAFQDREDIAKLLIDEGFSWDTVSEALHDHVPAYTSSLDAALPGENIVFTVRSERRGRWGAVHRSPDGRDHLRWAATECLARRLATLASLVAPQDEGGTGLSHPMEDFSHTGGTAAESRDWKVMF